MCFVGTAPSKASKLPSLEPFEKIILQWNFFTNIKPETNMSLEEMQQRLGGDFVLRKVPTYFEDADDYVHTFLPVFLLECMQSVYKANDSESHKPELMSQLTAWPHHGFTMIQLRRSRNQTVSFSFGDLLLLLIPTIDAEASDQRCLKVEQQQTVEMESQRNSSSYNESTSEATTSMPTQRFQRYNHILALVENATNMILTVKVLIPSTNVKDSDEIVHITKLLKHITESGSQWLVKKILSLSTMYREYQGLMSFPEIKMRNHLLCNHLKVPSLPVVEEVTTSDTKGRFSSTFASTRQELKPLSDTVASYDYMEISSKLKLLLVKLYDKSQFKAVMDCTKSTGITLVQGPPGTGKTTTIMGILSVLLSASPKSHLPHERLRRTSITASNHKQQSFEAVQKQLEVAQPWIYNSDYVPWYDEVGYSIDELEDSSLSLGTEADAGFLRITDEKDFVKPRRVLVCAPSNAAIDEIVERLIKPTNEGGGIFDQDGVRYTPNVVRLGPNIRPELVHWSLEYKAEIRAKAKCVQKNEDRLFFKRNILRECSIVCATQSMCGSRDMTAFADGFDTVVVDEASQGVELSTLIPLRMGCQRLILVGDHRQLSATVISRIAISLKYDVSLFQRLEVAGHHVNVLSVQYRMHPEISKFPSLTFYDSLLKDAENIHSYIVPPIPWYSIPIFKPIVFFTIDSAHTVGGNFLGTETKSLVNLDEAMFVTQLLELVGMILSQADSSSASWYHRIAIISPYSDQVQLIRHLVKQMLQTPDNVPCPIDINTVDGFQGREKDFVIFSAVRAHAVEESDTRHKNINIGFLADQRRLNVALTRARQNLWIVGNGRFLMGNPHWCSLWKHCCASNALFNVNFERFSKSNYLKLWLSSYLERKPEAKDMLDAHVPNFVTQIYREIASAKADESFKEIAASLLFPQSMDELRELQVNAKLESEDYNYQLFDEGDAVQNILPTAEETVAFNDQMRILKD